MKKIIIDIIGLENANNGDTIIYNAKERCCEAVGKTEQVKTLEKLINEQAVKITNLEKRNAEMQNDLARISKILKEILEK